MILEKLRTSNGWVILMQYNDNLYEVRSFTGAGVKETMLHTLPNAQLEYPRVSSSITL